ncbi:MAG: DNA-directed DNA polymerase I [Nitrososphaerales archaeon]
MQNSSASQSEMVTIPSSMLVSAAYDGDAEKVVLKFYDPRTQKIRLWTDDSGHKPYCYSKLGNEELSILKDRKDIIEMRKEQKRDLITDTMIEVTKIITTNPLAVGGTSEESIRNQIDAWEADIKYYENYLYDTGLKVGAFYEIKDSKIIPIHNPLPADMLEALDPLLQMASPESKERLQELAELLSQSLVDLKRVSLDIEVASSVEDRIPNPREAEEKVIAIGLVGSDGKREVHLPEKSVDRDASSSAEFELVTHDSEKELLGHVFKRLSDYPFIVTFNGDDFDLPYLYNRAKKLGFQKEEIPLALGRDFASVKKGVHIDLYRTFSNRSIQIYAFGNKYVDHTLNGVSEALLGKSKIQFEGSIGSLKPQELARYCYRDAEITFSLTSFSGDLLMKILTVLARISRMPMDDVARVGVSQWIRSMLYFEHRRMGAIIPRRNEIEEKGGAISEAVIKGKKYRGGLVFEPDEGVHFNVAVLDFASLYPSIISVHNLSYETVLCPHPECKNNLLPGMKNWVCLKRKGIASMVIGGLRDLRVQYYKPLAKKDSLDEDNRALIGVVSQALKVILNASYGVMGAEIFPLYCLPVAEATATIGRFVITKTIDRCKEDGITVVYGDTDSLFLKGPTSEQIDGLMDWASKELGVALDLDKNYRFVAFSSRKKNYMGVLPDGKVDIKGLTGKKSHTPLFVKEIFQGAVNTLSKVESEGEFEQARAEIKSQVKNGYQDLKNKRVTLEHLAFNVMVGKEVDQYKGTTPQHIRAAMLLEDKGKKIRAGDIISYVKTSTADGVKPVALAKIEEIDQAKYLETLRSTFDQLLDALGYDFDEILGATKLEDFFWQS